MNITMHNTFVFIPSKFFWIILRYGIIGSENINTLKLILPTVFPKMYHYRVSVMWGMGMSPHLCQHWEFVTYYFKKKFKLDEITCSQLGRFLESIKQRVILAGYIDE